MSIEKILIVDNDRLARDYLADMLRYKHFDVTVAESGKEALRLLDEVAFDMVIAEMKLSDLTEQEFLPQIKAKNPHVLIVVCNISGNAEKGVEVLRLGAFTYLQKPVSANAIEAVIEKASEHIKLIEENRYLRHQVSTGGSHTAPKVIGESPLMKQILSEAIQIAKSNASVLISGESGTGKEVIAHVIHYNSLRAQRPFIRVNCAAIPETLVESEFFGHEKGAFTGANGKRIGRFELATGGSLLLDEITEIPLSLQAKFLRAVQEQEIERVGGTKTVKIDVRLISTSNRDVKDAVASKQLREDLYYRLNVVPIHLPPLRDRREDIIPLAEYFLEKMSLDNKKSNKQLTEKAKKKLLDYSWPGNIRELANIIERAVVLDVSEQIAPEHLNLDALHLPGKLTFPAGISLQELERRFILETLQQNQNDPEKAALILGISSRDLRDKIEERRMESGVGGG